MKLYDYPASANWYKVRLALAQLNRAYERIPVDIFTGDPLTDEFAALNPSRGTPALQLDDDRVLVESGTILVYLAAGTALMPADSFAAAESSVD